MRDSNTCPTLPSAPQSMINTAPKKPVFPLWQPESGSKQNLRPEPLKTQNTTDNPANTFCPKPPNPWHHAASGFLLLGLCSGKVEVSFQGLLAPLRGYRGRDAGIEAITIDFLLGLGSLRSHTTMTHTRFIQVSEAGFRIQGFRVLGCSG